MFYLNTQSVLTIPQAAVTVYSLVSLLVELDFWLENEVSWWLSFMGLRVWDVMYLHDFLRDFKIVGLSSS